MADVFISYKREDRQTAERLANSLEQLGFDVWWDLDLLAGDRYRHVIREVIDQCSAAVVLWSAKSVDSDFVMDEANHAKKKGKLCPAIIDDVDLPFGFGQTHADDLRGWDGELSHAGFQGLVRSLEARVGRKAKFGALRRSAQAQALHAELEDFQAAQLAGGAAALRMFLSQHPRGAFAVFVRGQLESIDPATPPSPARPQPPDLPPRSERVERRRSAPPQASRRRLGWLLAGGGALVAAIVVLGLRFQAEEEERARVELAAHQARLDQERQAREAAESKAKELQAQAEQDRLAREKAERERLAMQQAQERDRLAREKAEQVQREADKQRQAAAQAEQQRIARERAAQEAKAREAAQQAAATAQPAAFDLGQLHPDVGAAAARARDAERRANTVAARARDAAAKARAGGVVKPDNGLGVASYSGESAGNEYAGQFGNGRWHGLGVANWGENAAASGALRTEGEFTNNLLNGYAVVYWRNGSRYAGAYRQNKRHGQGVLTYADGRRYEGEFVDSKFVGYGVFWSPQGAAVRAGVWADGKLATPLAR